MLRCAPKKSIKKPRKAASGHKEMLMPVECKKQANEMWRGRRVQSPAPVCMVQYLGGTSCGNTFVSGCCSRKSHDSRTPGNRVVQRAVA